eukprot:5958016-Prymnesium_polylepis.1
MPATAAADQQARARPAVARAAQSHQSVTVPGRRVHVRAHEAIGSSAQLSSPSACRLPADPSSSVSCSIRHG